MRKVIALCILLMLAITVMAQLRGRATLQGRGRHGKPGSPAVGRVQAGDAVYPLGASANVRATGTITGTLLGTTTQTIQGTVSSCAFDLTGQAWRRWCNVDFASGVDGWVVADSLRRVSDTIGAKTLLIIRVVYADHAGDANPLNIEIDDYVATANTEFSVDSYGTFSPITHTIAPSSGSFTLPNNYSYYSGASNGPHFATLLDDAHAVALAAGFNWEAYSYNMVYVPADYGGGFLGALSADRGAVMLATFQNNSYSIVPSYLIRLGMGERADAWNSNDSTVFGTAGSVVANGDPFDVFGTEELGTNFSLYHKNLGSKWIPNANVHQVTTNGTYRIYAQDTETAITAGRFYGIRMPGYINAQCSTCTEYFIEYRQDKGLLINWGGKLLLDMVPATEHFNDAPLTVALSPFTDPAGHTISISAASGSTPKFVDVTIGGL